MEHHSEEFLSKNQLIFCQRWQPDSSPKGVLLIAHGLAEHSGRYAEVAEFFVAHNYAVCCLDHSGHGQSEGQRGFINRFTDYTDTLDVFSRLVSQWFPESPVFLLGHSMGGLISALFLIQNQNRFAGSILSGPAIKASDEPSWPLLVIGRLLSALLPKTGIMQLEADSISRDPAVVAAYRNDPLVHSGKISARLATEIFSSMKYVQENATAITLPMLLLHGSEDLLAAPESSTLLHERISSADKQLVVYQGLYHEILNEPEKQQVLTTILKWLEQHGEPA
jgi:alpha-beta hydrolase superfamily lysophospholipase